MRKGHVCRDFAPYILVFRDIAFAPHIMPNIKPIMNPPPVTTLGIENTSIIIPHVFRFAGLICSNTAPINTVTPSIRPIAES